MAEITITLEDGFVMPGSEAPQTEVVLRELTIGDVIDATVAGERIHLINDEAVVVSSPTIAGAEMLCRQIVRVGDYDGEFLMIMLREGSNRDLKAMTVAADTLDSASLKGTTDRGRGDSPAGDST